MASKRIIHNLDFFPPFKYWRSEILTSLDFKWSKGDWFANDFEWDLKLEAQPFEIWTKMVGVRGLEA